MRIRDGQEQIVEQLFAELSEAESERDSLADELAEALAEIEALKIEIMRLRTDPQFAA